MFRRVLLTAVATLAGFTANGASASEFEQYCNLQGFSVPVRQTLLVLDEQHIYPEVKPGETKNLPWRRFIGNLLFADDDRVLGQHFLPRERVTIVIARKDGAGTRTVFSGCVPFFSTGERNSIAKNGGVRNSVASFFGADAVAAAKKSMDLFRIRIGDGFRDALQPSSLSAVQSSTNAGDMANSGLVSSLRQKNLIDFSSGLPRIIVYSDMSRFFPGNTDKENARQDGLQKGKTADLNLQGAEVHVVGMSGGASARDALEMFFLAAHAELISTAPASGLPNFAPSPVRVTRYQGTVQYPERRFPIRIRVAIDQNGSVVDSWVSVQTSFEQFSPIHGLLTCTGNQSCIFAGDDKSFSQVWNVKRAPFFNPEMPFGGARRLEFTIENGVAKGSISDPLINFVGLTGNKLEFTASLAPAALY